MDVLEKDLRNPDFLESVDLTDRQFDEQWATFQRTINMWIKRATPELESLVGINSITKLSARLRYLFYAQVYGGRFTKAELNNQKEVADLCYPSEWYPATRGLARTVHLHVGPTNSGKTYHALKRLEEADKGIYMGPLRLLAHEVYTRMVAKGRACALVTGDEQRIPEEDINMWSCTVEMAPVNQPLDVAVIDEIQMINHDERGWAWTQAYLGIMAKEIHLCGEARTVPLIRELAALVGDQVHVHEYERLTKLEVAPKSLRGRLSLLEKGDCLVVFSVLGIHSFRSEIEKKTGRKCAIIYGSLPPETRAQQARLFNDPDNDYDFLVASDAIGMGLNLSIKRVILESTVKHNGNRLAPLQISDIKQIAGRAGRYKTAQQAIDQAKDTQVIDGAIGLDDEGVQPSRPPKSNIVGYATTFDEMDYGPLKAAMRQEAPLIKTAGVFPPSNIIERFASYFPPGTPFSYIMLRLHEISEIHPRFHLCSLKDQLAIADCIHPVRNLSVSDRITLCAVPMGLKEQAERDYLRALAEAIAGDRSGNLLDLPSLPLQVLDEPPLPGREYLYRLESLHKMLVAYLWLSFRFPQALTTRALAEHTKRLVEQAIEDTLSKFSYTPQGRAALKKKRLVAMNERSEDRERASKEKKERGLNYRRIAGLPSAVQDMMHDTRPVEEPVSAPVDDIDEYPTPELEILGEEAVERLGKAERGHGDRTRELVQEANELLTRNAEVRQGA
ncbi:P-loop containing nucleoside triphosphate hydrolase protein [Corynespora cassiicola Philippines]|uniref:RNA helicase n=1 Tax=Corynespora cassiicola Philippines TaxID=1448308 RepID=A0A2T2N9A9_CORCC|nr:P-loop containing nucleoside triphosphate hydrolase protein [Corynespora cassiicola Philippines]